MMFTRLIALIALMLFVSACGPSASTSAEKDAVAWPALKTLDHQVHELEGVRASDPGGDLLNQQLGRVLASLSTLLAEDVPANVAQPELVRQKLEELRELSVELERSVDDLETAPLAALHPLVADLMEVAGMPHVHEDRDQDQDGQSHDHDH